MQVMSSSNFTCFCWLKFRWYSSFLRHTLRPPLHPTSTVFRTLSYSTQVASKPSFFSLNSLTF